VPTKVAEHVGPQRASNHPRVIAGPRALSA
jgi:hypothetical protein